MKVENLLMAKGTDVVTVSPDTTVSEALALLDNEGIGALVVSEDGRAVEGIVSERDIVRRLHRDGVAVLERRVADVMSADVITCTAADELASLMEVMTARRVRHVPVLAGSALEGIVSIGDVVKARVDELEDDRRALHEYITAR